MSGSKIIFVPLFRFPKTSMINGYLIRHVDTFPRSIIFYDRWRFPHFSCLSFFFSCFEFVRELRGQMTAYICFAYPFCYTFLTHFAFFFDTFFLFAKLSLSQNFWTVSPVPPQTYTVIYILINQIFCAKGTEE